MIKSIMPYPVIGFSRDALVGNYLASPLLKNLECLFSVQLRSSLLIDWNFTHPFKLPGFEMFFNLIRASKSWFRSKRRNFRIQIHRPKESIPCPRQKSETTEQTTSSFRSLLWPRNDNYICLPRFEGLFSEIRSKSALLRAFS